MHCVISAISHVAIVTTPTTRPATSSLDDINGSSTVVTSTASSVALPVLRELHVVWLAK